MGALRGQIFAITGDGAPEQVEGNAITANLFPVLGVTPILGRNFLPEEDRPGNHVALISHRLWQQRYGGSPSVVGRGILLDGVKHRVVGVMPRGFSIPERSDVWVPIALSPEQLQVRGSHYLVVMARLKPGITIAAAQREISAIAGQWRRSTPIPIVTWARWSSGFASSFPAVSNQGCGVLAGGVGSVLLISCANLAGLLLARAAGRRREMAIRSALGAGRLRLVRQGMVESLLIALLGGVLAVLLASWLVPLLEHMVPAVLAGWAQPKLDRRLMVFASGLCVLSSVLFGILPALLARIDSADYLANYLRPPVGRALFRALGWTRLHPRGHRQRSHGEAVLAGRQPTRKALLYRAQ